MDLKLDSVALVDLAAALEERFAVSVPATTMIEHATLGRLAEHLDEMAVTGARDHARHQRQGAGQAAPREAGDGARRRA